ncbi:hypothetical protein [Streptomyces globisporus]|uniref:hypothetical protein n=1 Tax=Streptomyces globisporus TaxID=1908 RepID=UPI00368C8173
MRYGDFEWHKGQADYWHGKYVEANKKASAAIAEAKKSKERELTAIRMMLKLKPFEKAIELDPSRLESALRMYVAELDYDIHKNIENNEEDGLDHYPDEVDLFLRCWETAEGN